MKKILIAVGVIGAAGVAVYLWASKSAGAAWPSMTWKQKLQYIGLRIKAQFTNGSQFE